MIKTLIQRIFGRPVEPTEDPKIERVVNIVGTKEEWWQEGFNTNSIFRVIDKKHEAFLLRESEFVIEAVAAEACPLTCPLNKFRHKHGCYSAS